MIGRSGERGSGISVLAARHDDDDDDDDDDISVMLKKNYVKLLIPLRGTYVPLQETIIIYLIIFISKQLLLLWGEICIKKQSTMLINVKTLYLS